MNKEIKSRIKDDIKYYIFLDEIQHIDQFEKALASFRATLNVSLFVTGSNSALLSGELATLLTGRTVEFEILPFSFYEMKLYYELNGKEFNDDLFMDYLKWGGFPLRFDYDEEVAVHKYLSNLYESIVNRDIVGRTKSADKKAFMDISLYILANAGKELSIDMGFRTINTNTINYEDTFFLENIIDFLLRKIDLILT
ncbi:MAG: AAA family ATPase [Eubacteriales bacterium]|nr:AAA family ATPase [Eubacteriales bacterium]